MLELPIIVILFDSITLPCDYKIVHYLLVEFSNINYLEKNENNSL